MFVFLVKINERSTRSLNLPKRGLIYDSYPYNIFCVGYMFNRLFGHGGIGIYYRCRIISARLIGKVCYVYPFGCYSRSYLSKNIVDVFM